MKELDLDDALPMAFEHYKKDSITVYELNMWCDEYMEKNPDVYVLHTRVDIAHEHGCNRIYWEIRDQKSDILHRQETVKCPCCGCQIIKYPNRDYYDKVVEMKRKLIDCGI